MITITYFKKLQAGHTVCTEGQINYSSKEYNNLHMYYNLNVIYNNDFVCRFNPFVYTHSILESNFPDIYAYHSVDCNYKIMAVQNFKNLSEILVEH